MRNIANVTAIVIGLVTTSACDDAPHQSAAEAAGDRLIHQQVIEEDAVKSRLRDPESAVFEHGKKGCGLVNSKNGFGGMSGNEGYIITPDGTLFLQEDISHPLVFQDLWKTYCTPKSQGSSSSAKP